MNVNEVVEWEVCYEIAAEHYEVRLYMHTYTHRERM